MSVYNDAQHLSRAIRGILEQTGVEFEFIIINDGSIDNSLKIIEDHAQQDHRIRVINQDNQGLTMSLIRGCNEARAPFIARQDSDDVSQPGRLAALHAALVDHPDAMFASSWTSYVGPQGEALYTVKRPSNPVEATHKLLHEKMGPPAHGSVMFRKSAYQQVGGYRRQFYYGQDSDLWLRLARHGQIVYVPEVYYVAQKHPMSISGSNRTIQAAFGRLARDCHVARMERKSETPWLEAADELRRQVIELEPAGRTDRLATARANYLIGSSLQRNGDGRAIEYLLRAVRTYPFLWRAWPRLALGLCCLPWNRHHATS